MSNEKQEPTEMDEADLEQARGGALTSVSSSVAFKWKAGPLDARSDRLTIGTSTSVPGVPTGQDGTPDLR